MSMNNKQRFVIAALIIGTISALLLITFIEAAVRGENLSKKGAEFVAAIIMALIAVVSFIVGKSNKE